MFVNVGAVRLHYVLTSGCMRALGVAEHVEGVLKDSANVTQRHSLVVVPRCAGVQTCSALNLQFCAGSRVLQVLKPSQY